MRPLSSSKANWGKKVNVPMAWSQPPVTRQMCFAPIIYDQSRAGVTNDIWRSSPGWSQAVLALLIIYDPLQLRNGKHKWSITFFSPTSQTPHGFPLFKRRNEAKFVFWPEREREREGSQHCLGPVRHSIFSSQTAEENADWDGNINQFWHLAGAVGPNIYICTFLQSERFSKKLV